MRNKKLVLIVLMAMSTRDVQAAMPNEKQAAALAWSMRYDEADRITSITDPAGRKTAIAYNVDERNRLRTVTRTHTDETKVTWSIDQFGRRAGMTDVAAGGPLCI
ncbi:MAG: RHS repeat domain-containing protein, partial [Thermoguttaceae bacterium]